MAKRTRSRGERRERWDSVNPPVIGRERGSKWGTTSLQLWTTRSVPTPDPSLMFRPSRTKTALAAAAGLGGLGAAAVAGGPPPEAPPDHDAQAGPVASQATENSDYGVAARAAESAKQRGARATGRKIAARARARAKRRAERRRGYSIVRLKAGTRVLLRAKPGGRVVRRVNARTEFGSPQTLAVVKRRGRWLGVTSSTLPNGKVAWVNGRSAKVQEKRTRVSLHVDLSRRMLEMRDGRHRRIARVSLGAKVSPTPTGRFAITDKLSGQRYGGVYGCCILALSGKQPNPPAGWKGGNRLAIHGTNAPGAIGKAASAGCLRGGDRDMKLLMRRVPVGTPVFIRS